MTYRAVVRHVRYWRGNVHHWSTVYQFVGTPSKPLDTAAAILLNNADDDMCMKTVAAEGGTYGTDIYNVSTGGSPIISFRNFDPTNLAAWPGYGHASAWGNVAANIGQPAENALVVEWAAGLSKSGKPVSMKKWYHAVPSVSPGGATVDIPPATVTALTTAAQGLVGVWASYGLTLGSASGRFAGVATVKAQYGNHQMPRGRRRKALVTAGGKYTGPTIVIPD